MKTPAEPDDPVIVEDDNALWMNGLGSTRMS
jgi:hypothetical protein